MITTPLPGGPCHGCCAVRLCRSPGLFSWTSAAAKGGFSSRRWRSHLHAEFSPYLCRIARNNLCSARLLRRRNADAQVVCTDAVDFPIPEGPLLLYFSNPFNEEIMERVLDNIVGSYLCSQRPIYLVFYGMSSQKLFISRFLADRSAGKARERLSMLAGKRTVYVFELAATS